MTSIINQLKNKENKSTFLSYLHCEDRAAVIARYFSHLKDLAITTLPNNFTKFEILRSDPFSSAIDILFRYGYRFDTFRSIKCNIVITTKLNTTVICQPGKGLLTRLSRSRLDSHRTLPT